MISSIRGKIILKNEKFLIVETGGVGYKIFISPDTLSKITLPISSSSLIEKSSEEKNKEEVFFYIHSHIREDAFDLYGFLDYKELEFFEMLINVSGIGPKSALIILSIASIETLKKAIGTEDISYLTKISGIGKKTAEKIVIELRDKIGEEKSNISLKGELDALEALKSLGYSQSEAREALKKVSIGDTNAKIRQALKILGGK